MTRWGTARSAWTTARDARDGRRGSSLTPDVEATHGQLADAAAVGQSLAGRAVPRGLVEEFAAVIATGVHGRGLLVQLPDAGHVGQFDHLVRHGEELKVRQQIWKKWSF